MVVSGSYWAMAFVLGLYSFTVALWAGGFERGAVVSVLVTLMILKVDRLRPALAAALFATGVLAATVGAVTRGTEEGERRQGRLGKRLLTSSFSTQSICTSTDSETILGRHVHRGRSQSPSSTGSCLASFSATSLRCTATTWRRRSSRR